MTRKRSTRALIWLMWTQTKRFVLGGLFAPMVIFFLAFSFFGFSVFPFREGSTKEGNTVWMEGINDGRIELDNEAF